MSRTGTEPDTSAHRVRNQTLELVQDVCVQDVASPTFLCEIELKSVDALLAQTCSHAAGATDSPNKEWTRDQVEVSRLGSNVSTV